MTKTSRELRTFYILILTQTFSMIGSRISGLAIGIEVFNDTGNATPLALVAFFSMIPMVLASSLSGVLADRWDRRYVMILSDFGQAIGTVFLLISFGTNGFQLWHLYAVVFISSIFGVFQGPAFQASVTMLIPDNHRDRANAIQQLTGPLAGVFAPAIAGLIYAAVGVEGAIIFDLMTFVVAMAVVFSIQIPRPEQTEIGKEMAGSVWKESLTGFKYLLRYRSLLLVVLFISFLNFLISGAMVLTTPYLLARTGDAAMMGLLLSLNNLGAIVGGVFIGIWGGTRPRMKTIIPSMLIAAVVVGLIGVAQTPAMLGLTLFLFMLPIPIVNALFMSIMQAKVAPDIQGRVFSVLGQFSMLLTPPAYLIAGPLADKVFEPAVGKAGWDVVAPLVGNAPGAGMGLIFVICGVLTTLLCVVMFSQREMRDMETLLPDYVATPADAKVPQTLGEAVMQTDGAWSA